MTKIRTRNNARRSYSRYGDAESVLSSCSRRRLLLVLLGLLTTSGGGGLLSADTAGAAAAEGRVEGEVNVLLGVETDDERRNVDDLLADADVTLADQDTGVVDGLGKAKLVDAGLEATLKEILDLEGKNVIKLHAGLIEDTDADETANEGVAFEKTLGVLLVEGEQLTSSTTNLGQGQSDAPDLTLVAEAVLADELQLGITITLYVSKWSQTT